LKAAGNETRPLFTENAQEDFRLMSHQKVASITDANPGVGFAVVRQPAGKSFHVFLAAR